MELMETIDTSSVSADTLESTLRECPACGFASPDGTKFSTCQRCGLIVSKYFQHQRSKSAADTDRRTCSWSLLFMPWKRMLIIAGTIALSLSAVIGALLLSRTADNAKQDYRMA